jgi:hypothetical protein
MQPNDGSVKDPNAVRSHFKTLDISHLASLQRSAVPVLQLLAVVLENVVSHCFLHNVNKLGRASRSLVFLLNNAAWLYHVLRYTQPMNAQQTRWVFLLPHWVTLTRVGRSRYAGHDALATALRGMHSLQLLRHRHKRRVRRMQQNELRRTRYTERMGRFITALAASKLSSSLLYSSHWGLRFRLVARWADDEYAEHVLQTCVQQLCVSWYLTRYTNYSQALEQHVREFGHYSQAANVVAQHYPLPTQWPWLHANV